MALDPNRLSVQRRDQLNELQGEVHALKGVLAVLIGHISLLARAPLAKREEILRSLTLMLPDALARIEHDAPPAVAAGFERGIEGVTHMARNAVRIEPINVVVTFIWIRSLVLQESSQSCGVDYAADATASLLFAGRKPG